MFEGVETGPMVYHPKLRRLESLTICSFITKAALSLQFLQDPECWSIWGLNQWPAHIRQARAYLQYLM